MADPRFIRLLKVTHPFRNLDDDLITEIAEHSQLLEYPERATIYAEGDDPEGLFIVFSGKVRISRHVVVDGEDEDESLGLLEEGAILGFEALEPMRRNQLSAVAETDTQLLFPDPDWFFDVFLPAIPGLLAALDMLRNGYYLSLRINLFWRDPDEAVYYIARRHPLFLFLRLTLPLVISLVLLSLLLFLYTSVLPLDMMPTIMVVTLICTLLIMGWNFIDERNDFAVITSRRAVYLNTIILIYQSSQEVPLEAILSDKVDTNLFGRTFHYGNVVIRTYTGALIFRRLRYPDQILSIIEDLRARVRSRTVVQHQHELEDMMRRRLFPPAEKPSPDEEGAAEDRQAEVSSVSLRPRRSSGLFSNLFRLRIEQDGVITYRQHYLILAKKTVLAFFANLLLITGFVFALSGHPFFANSLVLIALIVLELAAFIWWAYQYADWVNDRYIITDTQIVDVYKKPLGTEQRATAPIKNILSIEFTREGLIGLIFNYGTVYIRVGDENLTFDHVFNPAEVQRELFQRLADLKRREKQQADEDDQQRISDIILAYHTVLRNSPPEEG